MQRFLFLRFFKEKLLEDNALARFNSKFFSINGISKTLFTNKKRVAPPSNLKRPGFGAVNGMKLLTFFLIFSIPLYAIIDEEVDIQKLRYFWDTTPSAWGHSHYYTLEINNEIFQGLRPWQLRWELYNKDEIFKGKKVIDLGSNIGIPSIFIKKYGQASLVFAVEKDPKALFQLNQLKEIFNVDIICYNLDFEKDYYEKILGYDYDIVLCASTFHWIAKSKKEQFLHYLSHFNQVLYEGHESLPIEMHRFRNIGFKYYRILGKADYNRWIILFSKIPFKN